MSRKNPYSFRPILYYGNDTRAKEFCESLIADLRDDCLRSGEGFHENFEIS